MISRSLLVSFLIWTLLLLPAIMADTAQQAEEVDLSKTAGISGRVVSCPAWTLNRLPAVKKFLKGGEAEQYENLHITWIRGKTPILTIFKDGVKQEEVPLSSYKDTQDLHKLMVKKGFKLKKGLAKTKESSATTAGGVTTRLGGSVQRKDIELPESEEGEEEDPVLKFNKIVTGVGMLALVAFYLVRARKRKMRSV